ncbi:MAG: hypothetical protein IJA23_01250 [Clostridia bacterium]|nr:hypothetical protein [Clostridia bacterium]
MNKIKKFFNSKKKAIFSFMLAVVLMLSFNYSPISLLADLVRTNAYKSNTVQTYYANSSTTSETNIGAGVYPSSLSDYFKDSSNNFNIESYYNTRFNDILAGHVDEFLKNVPDVKVGPTGAAEGDKVLYKDLYQLFLDSVEFDTLLEYYTKNKVEFKTKYGCETFKDYAEYFVSHDIEFQTTDPNNPTKTLYAFPNCVYTEGSHEYKVQFYNILANHITGENKVIEDSVEVEGDDGEVIGNFRDGVADGTKFYAQSISYGRVKKHIDDQISATIAIYTYDNETQNKNVAAILANNAPASMSYFFKDNTYETKIEEVQKYVMNTTEDKKSVYIFTAETQTIKDSAAAKGITTMVYDDTGSLLNNHQKYPLLYRPIKSTEYGYLDNYVTYYKYESIPYQTLSDGNYSLFVADDNVTPDEQATYNFLYVNTIDPDDINESYVEVPLPSNDTDRIYFTTLLGITPSSTEDQARFDNLVELFTDDKGTDVTTDDTCKLYLKYKTTERKVIYIQSEQKNQFEIDNQNYSYFADIVEVDYASLTDEQKEEYYEIDGSKFSNYYVTTGYTLYFKKVKENYKTLESVQYEPGQYETKKVPNIPFEQHEVVSKEYEMDSSAKKVYVLIPEEGTNTTSYTEISQADLDSALNNEFVKVPDSIVEEDEMDNTFTYYYRHKKASEKVNKIYIVVSDENYETEKDNEVYKNLNYTVISKSDYKYKEFIAIEKTDANYNENFKLYYKYKSEDQLGGKNIYIQNQITKKNALYIIDDSVTSSDKTTYKDNGRNFITMTTAEYEANYRFYTQLTSDDEFYNLKYTVYYKYNSTEETERLIYTYSTDNNSEYETFTSSSTDYLASDYELIDKDDPNYVEGTNLYYKKIRKAGTENYKEEPNITTYSYTTTSAVSLNANSYYVVSFYVYTNGTYNDPVTPGTPSKPMQASLYVEDSKGYITNAAVENISTEGKWQKRYLFIATNSLSASSIKLSMFMGSKDSIIGSESENFKTATGVVMFDEIKITKINQTDYTKLAIDDKVVQTPPVVEEPESPDPGTPDPASVTPEFDYVDKYGNEIIATSVSSRVNNVINIFNGQTFDKMYDFDSLTSTFESISFADADNVDGYTLPTTELWQMYISRDVSGQGNNYILKQYQKAYKDGKLSVAVVDEESFYDAKLESIEDEDDDDKVIDSDAPDADKTDVEVIKSTFKDNNKVLQLKNTSRQLNLGLISNYFKVEQAQYYKLTVWIYSPDEDASATLTLSSILKTASTQDYGSLLTSTADVKANMKEYTTSQANEYGWIPISFFIEGNALHSQNCYLTLCANKNTTVYFDNISIEKITSSAYDTANSDSDKTTFCLSLAPSTSMLSAGVTNGYFSNVTVTDNYNEIDYTIPRTAESWTVSQKSNEVVAGVIPTTAEYLANSKTSPDVGTFYDKYNNYVVPTNELKYNIYGIYIPATISNPLNNYGGNDTATYEQSGIYRFYTSSISLSASTTYKLSFEFLKGYNFDGKLFASIYTSAVKDANLIETMVIDDSIIEDGWNEYSFYISTDTASTTIYLELGVKNATGTCFFRNVSNVSQTKSIDEIRDDMLPDDKNVATPDGQPVVDIYEKDCFKYVRFVELNAFEFSVHGQDKDTASNLYESKEFTNDLKPTTTFTTGETGVTVASYYTTYETVKYTVTIDKVEYYIKEFVDESTGDKSYKLYSDSNYTDEITVLNGKKVTLDGKNKVIVGTENETEYTITETTKTNYIYNFENDLTINNVFISADELKNEISENVIVIANSYSTDYTFITPKYNTKLDASSYYVLKFYVKTSAFEDGFGLNIDLDSSISRKWTNIDTTDSKYDDLRDEKYGFVCYQVLISTGTSAISTFSAKFSLGSKDSTGSGYAIIAGIELEKFATEKLFNEYSLNYDDVDKDSNDTIIKSYFGTVSNSSSTSDSSSNKNEEEEEVESSMWATFFYIFSSLLLGIVIILALVATIIKKHPIKVVKQEQNDHDRESTFVTSPSASKSSKTKVDEKVETEEVIEKDDGFV